MEMFSQAIACARRHSGKKAVGRKRDFTHPLTTASHGGGGRGPRPNRKLSDDQVRWARSQEGLMSQDKIGKALGCSGSLIADIFAFNQYADVD